MAKRRKNGDEFDGSYAEAVFFVSPPKKLYNVNYIIECEEQKNESTYL
jgi:hypothetical protein